MKNLLIIQSIPTWVSILEAGLSKPAITETYCISITDSFDHAIDLIPREGEVIVITSEMFHDEYSNFRKSVTQKIPDKEKSANKLAELVKAINNKAKVYTFSEFSPNGFEYLDGCILKNKHKPQESINDIIKILK